MVDKQSIHGEWSSRFVFILAATGSAVGLGNIWKFPYITGENGGGAFVLIYLLCIAIIGMPIMIAEIMLGRRGKQSPINTMRELAIEAQTSKVWQIIGIMGVFTGLLILSYYSVVGGWTLAYIYFMGTGTFSSVASSDTVKATFGGLVSSPEQLIMWHTIFMAMTMSLVAGGVKHGLEKGIKFLMPALVILLLVLVGYAMTLPTFAKGIHFLFYFDPSKLNTASVLVAMGHAFFTLSLGMGAIMVYGAYLPKKTSIIEATTVIVAADTVIALLAGIAIFPVVFNHGLTASAGTSLVFQSLPLSFAHISGGIIFGTIFFILLAIAAWTSALSILEPIVSWVIESLKLSRLTATIVCGVLIWALGFLSAFSFNILGDFKPLAFTNIEKFAGMNLFALFDFLTSNILLPLGGLLMAIFVGWFMRREHVADELDLPQEHILYQLWHFLLRFITPVGITIVFLHAVGLLTF